MKPMNQPASGARKAEDSTRVGSAHETRLFDILIGLQEDATLLRDAAISLPSGNRRTLLTEADALLNQAIWKIALVASTNRPSTDPDTCNEAIAQWFESHPSFTKD